MSAAEVKRFGPAERASLLTDLRRLDALERRETPTPRSSRLAELGRRLGLDDFDLDVVLLALGPLLTPRPEPTVGSALELLAPTIELRLARVDRFGAGAPLTTTGVLRRTDAAAPLAARRLALVDAVVEWLLALRPETGGSTPTVLGLRGSNPRLKREAATAFAEDAGAPLVVVDSVDQTDAGLPLRLRLSAAAVLLMNVAELGDPAAQATAVAAARAASLVMLDTPDPPAALVAQLPPIVRVDVEALPTAARRRGWRRALGGARVGRATFDALSGRFELTEAERGAIVAEARLVDPATFDEALLEGARRRVRPEFGTLVRRVEPRFDWDDLVLPEDEISHLREICAQVRHREAVRAAGFERKYHLGRGLSVLLSGASGTGKGMAVEVISHDLGLDLFRIDLSQVIDKYVGETEKRLEQVFRAAEGSSVVLFFDEADALFGKRSETKDAHDRYANVELAYLLQRIETYDGIAVLATNLRANVDQAFMRRMTFAIDFPLPEREARAEIWRRVWPGEALVSDDIDVEGLAERFELSGGFIRNIAVGAAHLAAEDGSEIGTRHVLRAARREYQKLGHRLAEAPS